MRKCNSCRPNNTISGNGGCFECSSEGSNYIPAYVKYQVWSTQKKRLEPYITNLDYNGEVLFTSKAKYC